ncbi:hypothetical protein [Indioceanicola profundi]|uniref:hypothetical protein n=1 Tax=Indioceanicola profundi TaxID=2220096 RepID=UPI000E6AAF4A|nr:hypothetical protein [Indioceanicola profundi]
MRCAAAALLTVVLAACSGQDASAPDNGEQEFEERIAEECTYAGLSTGECAALMHYCFNDIERCEILGRPIRPEG